MLTLRISDEQLARVRLALHNPSAKKGIQLQTHPNIDKELLKAKNQIGLKRRFQTTDEANLPLSINCWPSDNGQGGCDVNIEYELEQERLELNDVVASIPIPHGVN